MKHLILAVALSLSIPAFANCGNDKDVGTPCEGGAGGAGGNGGQGGNGGNGGNGGEAIAVAVQSQSNKQSVNVAATTINPENQTIKYEGGYKVRNVPNVAIGGPASGPCNGFSGGIGGSGVGFGFAVNTSTVDKGCEQRETARIAAMLGRTDIANAVLENISIVKEALAARDKAEAAKPVVASPAESSAN